MLTWHRHPESAAIARYLCAVWPERHTTAKQMAEEIAAAWGIRVHPYTVARWGQRVTGIRRHPGRYPERICGCRRRGTRARCTACGRAYRMERAERAERSGVEHRCGEGRGA